MPSVTGSLSNVYSLTAGRQTVVSLPTQDSTLLDSVVLYNYSPLLCMVVTGGLHTGWLSPWSVDRFKLGNAGTVTVQPQQGAAGTPNTVQPVSAELVAAFILIEESDEHFGTYPCSLFAPDQGALALLGLNAQMNTVPAGALSAVPTPPAHPVLGAAAPGAVTTRVFTPNYSESYRQGYGWRGATSDGNAILQGMYQSPGNHWGWIGFGDVFRSVLAGKQILRTELYLHRLGNGGIAGPVQLWVYESSDISRNAGQPVLVNTPANPGGMSQNDARWFDLPNYMATDLGSGAAYSLCLHTNNGAEYGIWLSYTSADPPLLRVTYQ